MEDDEENEEDKEEEESSDSPIEIQPPPPTEPLQIVPTPVPIINRWGTSGCGNYISVTMLSSLIPRDREGST